MSTYVQYGCGFCAPEGWLSFDSSPTLRFERLPVVGRLCTRNAQRFPASVRYGDIVKGLPIDYGSCEGIYCSHILEHLALEDLRTALCNTLSYLKPGGTFRLVVPDLEVLAREYLVSNDADAAHQFLEASFLGVRQRARTLTGLLRQWIGNSAHLWMWDERSMAKELAEVGFTGIRRAAFGDWQDAAFAKVEDAARFEGALAMQCFRRQSARRG